MKSKDGLNMLHGILFKQHVFPSTYAGALTDTETPSSNVFYLLTKPTISFRPTQDWKTEPYKPFGDFVIIGSEFHGPSVCFTNATRDNVNVFILRKPELVSAFQLCGHGETDMKWTGLPDRLAYSVGRMWTLNST